MATNLDMLCDGLIVLRWTAQFFTECAIFAGQVLASVDLSFLTLTFWLCEICLLCYKVIFHS